MRGGVVDLALVGLSLRFIETSPHAAAIATGCNAVMCACSDEHNLALR